ncbi:MAG: Do family serine endopeptidase [Treponema sp.]|jgi:Do/DeqQ family serine protease|nr:Do family serine endopeptidase [Treponema sp.]
MAQKLSLNKLLIFNLVLIGVIFGSSVTFLSFSCSTLQSQRTARAEAPSVIIPEDALAVAESLQSAFHAVADKVLSSVVEIDTVSIQRRPSQNFNGIPWDFFFGPNTEEQERNREFRSQGVGSGIVVRRDGDTYYVLTNNHVITGASEIEISSNERKRYSAELVGYDERKDLAMIKFTTKDVFPLATLGDSDSVRIGDWAIAVGNPLGYLSSVTMGIISAVGREGGPAGNINDFIQTDASINQGNSGGALVNIKGEVIAINTWIASSTGGGSVGLGFAIPINNAKRLIDEFITTGQISYGWLGVSLIEADREILQALGVEGKRGAFASQVFLNSPAYKGGIRPGDFITHVNGKEVRSPTSLTLAVGELRAGEQAQFTLIRGGESRTVTVRIEARNEEVMTDNKNLWPGIYLIPLTEAMKADLELENSKGLYVVQVYPETPAAIIGLQRGDQIIGINGKTVSDLPSFYQMLNSETTSELSFSIIRGNSELETLKFKR